jgi:hypothetical protein
MRLRMLSALGMGVVLGVVGTAGVGIPCRRSPSGWKLRRDRVNDGERPTPDRGVALPLVSAIQAGEQRR